MLNEFECLATVEGELLEDDLKTYFLNFRDHYKGMLALKNFDLASGYFDIIFGRD
jgi:hypothetical protein